jgi:RHS repeat-associated protein
MLSLRRLARSHAVRRALLIGAALLLVTTSIEVLPAPVLAMTVSPSAAQDSPAGPSDASLSSKPAPTEVTALRSAYSDTYDNHDGTYTAHISPSPINYQPSGSTSWAPIDLSFASVNSSGRVGVSKTPAAIQVGSPTDAAGFVSVATLSGTIDLRLPATTAAGIPGSKPTISAGGRAYLKGLLPSADLEVLAEPSGARTFLVLSAAPSSNVFVFALDCPGLTPALQTDGSISFVNSSGSAVATMPAPVAVDSTPNAGLGGGNLTTAVAYSLSGAAGSTLLTVTVDPSFLANATYPVYVDPTINLNGSNTNDTFVSSKYPTENFNTYARPDSPYYNELWLGMDPTDSGNVNYDLFKFSGLGPIVGTVIDSANLEVFPYWQYMHYQSVTTWIDTLNANWYAGSATWNNQPSSTPLTSAQTTQGTMARFDVTSTLQAYANGGSFYGFKLHENGHDGKYWKRLIASEEGGADQPVLVVTYHTPVVSNLVPSAAAWTSSRVLSWAFSDPDGFNQKQYELVLATNSSFTSPLIDATVTSAATSYNIPAATSLTDGTTYYWEVRGNYPVNSVVHWSPYVSGSFKWDHTAPTWSGFTAPPSQLDQSGSAYTFAWTAAGGGATIATYGIQLQSAQISATANTCNGAGWTNVGNPVTVTTTSYAASSLSDATCYRVGVAATDSAGNIGSINYSSPVLRDSTAPAAPVVVDDTTIAPTRYGNNYIIYFRPSGPRSLTLTSTGSDGESGIASSTFGSLSAPTGWTYTAGTVSGNSASKTIAWTTTAGATTLAITTKNNAGTSSAPTTLTFTPLTGAVADFLTPDEGTTALIKPTGTYSVAWAEFPGTGDITGRSLQRQIEAPDPGGLCTLANWANDGSPSLAVSPVTASGLLANNCYRWVQSLTDSTGTHGFNSGAVVVDGSAPLASITAPAGGTPLSGSLTVTGVASDTHLANYTLAYGAGPAPTSWTTFAGSTLGVGTSGPLGLWATNPLTGVYTLRLTVTDYAGNSSVATALVYLDNTEHGGDPYNTAVPYDLGGGWNLGVNVATGEASLSRDLFSIPSYGPPQALSLAYNSADTSTAGPFGTGWSSNLTQYLSFESGFVVWHRADGGRVPFGQIAGVWSALAGHYEKLSTISGGYKITETDQSSYSFDGSGRLSAITDRFGVSLALSWGTSSATATDASNRVTTIAIDSVNHRITDVTDSAGRHWGFAYTGSNLTGITDPAGNLTTLTYTGSNQLSGVSRLRTPASGPVQTILWSLGYTAGQVTSVTDPIGGATNPIASSAFAYGSDTTTVRVLRDASNPGAPLFNTSSYFFDSHGRVTWTSDPDGWATASVFDANGNVTSSSRQVNATTWATTTTTYDTAGNKWVVTDPLGAVTTNSYRTLADGTLTSDVLTTIEDPGLSPHLAHQTAYVYDTAGHLCRKVENPDSGVVVANLGCTGTLGGNADQDIDTQYAYTPNNQLQTETDPLGIVTSHGYDTNGNQINVTHNYVAGQNDDSTSVTTSWTFDTSTASKAGYPASETDPIEAATSNSPAVTRTTSYAYDLFGNVLTKTVPGDANAPSLQTLDTYDEFGNTLVETQQAATPQSTWTTMSATTNVYDLAGRATSVTTVTPTATTTTSSVYDVAGDQVSDTAADGTITTNTYDGAGQVLSEQAPGVDATTNTYDGLGDETVCVEPAPGMGVTTTTSVFDLDGQMTSQTIDTNGTPATTTHVFDVLGRETSSTDPAGLTTVTTYDGMGRVTRTVATDPNTHVATVIDTSYDKDGEALTVTGPYFQGQTAAPADVTVYDALGRATSQIENYLPGSQDPGANITTTTYYDAGGDAVATVSPTTSGNTTVTRTMFDIAGDAWETISNCLDNPPDAPALCAGNGGSGTASNPTNIVSSTQTSASGAIESQTSTSGGVTTTSTYDGAGRVISSILDPGSGTHLNLLTQYAYDGTSGRQTRSVSPGGMVTYTVYDSQGRTLQTIENCTDSTPGSPPGSGWASCTGTIGAHDGTWNLVTSYAYDDAGNKVSETAPNGTTTTYTYDNQGHMLTQTADYVAGYAGSDPTVNATTSYYYDANGRRVATKAPTSSGSFAITLDKYDASGNLTQETLNCTSSGTAPTSGDLSNPASCTGGGTHNATTNIVTTYTYDKSGNKLSMTAPSPANGASGTASVTTYYAYDANNHLCRVLENANTDLQSLAIPCTTAVAGPAPLNVSTTYSYYPSGQLWQQNDPSPAGTTTYAYDNAGRLTSQTDADGNTTSWTYDAGGNKTSETDPDGQHLYWFYDAAERLCQRAALNPGVGYTAPSDPCTGAVSGAAIDTQYSRDFDGNVIAATDVIAARTISSTYDPLDRPTSVSGDTTGDPSTTYTYDLTNPSRTDASGTYAFTLDDYGREAGLTNPLPLNNPYAWTYTASGLVASVTDPTANVTTNTYDPLNRLNARSTTGSTGCTNCVSLTDTYNDASDIVLSTSTIAPSSTSTTTYAYDPLARLTTYTPPSAIQPQVYTWNGQPDRASITIGNGTKLTTTFDAASRPTIDSLSRTYTSDNEGRITSFPITGSPGEALTYDALGRLTQVKDSSGTVLATYTYDALDRLRTATENSATTRFLYVGLTNAVAQENNTSTGIINHATDMAGVDLFDFNATGNVSGYLGRNVHSDVVWTANTTGAVAATLTYDPFGNLVSSTGSTLPNTRWQSSYRDTATGLYYVIARWFAPSLGTFLSDDPLTASQADPQARDPYAYGAGDPTNTIDPNGRCLAYVWDGMYSYCSVASPDSAQELQDAQERAADAALERNSRRKYSNILTFMVKQLRMHATGSGLGGANAVFHNCEFCDGSWTSDLALALDPIARVSDVLSAASFGVLFSSQQSGCDARVRRYLPGAVGFAADMLAGVVNLPCGAWDDKYALTSWKHGRRFFASQNPDLNVTLINSMPGWLLSYTFWGNVDFAYTGLSWGFTKDELETGGWLGSIVGIAGYIENQGNKDSRAAGYELWSWTGGNPMNLSTTMLDHLVYESAGNLERRTDNVITAFRQSDYGRLQGQGGTP